MKRQKQTSRMVLNWHEEDNYIANDEIETLISTRERLQKFTKTDQLY